MKEFLIKLLEFVDKETDWKENNDTTNNQVVNEFMDRNYELAKLNTYNFLIKWEQYKKANWWESDAIDVESILIDRFINEINHEKQH